MTPEEELEQKAKKLTQQTDLTPEERLMQKAKNLMHLTACSPEDAIVQASKEFGNLANQAEKLQNVKQQVEWDLRFGKQD